MQINNNSNVAFGTKVPQKLLTEIENASPVLNKYWTSNHSLMKNIEAKAEEVRKFGKDSFEIGITKDVSTQKDVLCLKNVTSPNGSSVMLPKNGKINIVSRFLSLKKEDIVSAERKLKKISSLEEIKKRIIKFR